MPSRGPWALPCEELKTGSGCLKDKLLKRAGQHRGPVPAFQSQDSEYQSSLVEQT